MKTPVSSREFKHKLSVWLQPLAPAQQPRTARGGWGHLSSHRDCPALAPSPAAGMSQFSRRLTPPAPAEGQHTAPATQSTKLCPSSSSPSTRLGLTAVAGNGAEGRLRRVPGPQHLEAPQDPISRGLLSARQSPGAGGGQQIPLKNQFQKKGSEPPPVFTTGRSWVLFFSFESKANRSRSAWGGKMGMTQPAARR